MAKKKQKETTYIPASTNEPPLEASPEAAPPDLPEPGSSRILYARLIARGFNSTLLISDGDLKGEYVQLRDAFLPERAQGDNILTIAVSVVPEIG